MAKKRTAVTLRVPEALLANLKQDYADSYPYHRESFNTWVLGILAAAHAQFAADAA